MKIFIATIDQVVLSCSIRNDLVFYGKIFSVSGVVFILWYTKEKVCLAFGFNVRMLWKLSEV